LTRAKFLPPLKTGQSNTCNLEGARNMKRKRKIDSDWPWRKEYKLESGEGTWNDKCKEYIRLRSPEPVVIDVLWRKVWTKVGT
jgi:hypothetical protein